MKRDIGVEVSADLSQKKENIHKIRRLLEKSEWCGGGLGNLHGFKGASPSQTCKTHHSLFTLKAKVKLLSDNKIS